MRDESPTEADSAVPSPVRHRRSTALIVVICVAGLLVAGIAVGAWALLRSSAQSGPECTVPRPTDEEQSRGGPLTLDAVQLQHASTIDAVGLARGVPERARVIALATAWQESGLRNLDHGDRDSVGLFQQRPSQGWGRTDQIMDPIYAATKFYDALLTVPDWQQMSLTEAAQAVQRAAFPDAYAKWEDDARALAAQLGGTTPVTLSCRRGAAASTAPAPHRPAPSGTAAADPALAEVLAAAQAELGGLTVTAVDADGLEATVTITLAGAPAQQAGRALAAWAVAHATTMQVTRVAVLDRIWSGPSWSPADSAALPAGAAQLEVPG